MTAEERRKLTSTISKLGIALSFNTKASYRWAVEKIWKGLEFCMENQHPDAVFIATHLDEIKAWVDNYALGRPKVAKIFYSALMMFRPVFMDPLFNSLSCKISELNKDDKQNEEKQEWTPAQEKIKLPWSDVILRRNNLEKACQPIWNLRSGLITPSQWQQLNDFVLLCLYTMNPPRRREFGEVLLDKPNDDDTVGKNWIEWSEDAKGFFFNVYKTAKTYGLQFIPASPALTVVIEKWLNINPSPYLLFNQRKGPIGSRGVNRSLERIFNTKGMGVNMLRHTFISDEVLKGMPFLDDLNIMAKSMGHSVQEALLYKKH